MIKWIGRLLGRREALERKTLPEPAVDAGALREQGNRDLAEGRLHDAAASYRQALLRHPHSVQCAVNLAFVLLELDQPQPAVIHLRQALDLEPANADAHFMLGRIALQAGDWADAVAHLSRVIERQPALLLAYPLLCRALAESGEHGAAMGVLQAGLRLDPEFADLHQAKGNLLMREGDMADAIASYRQACALAPHSAEAKANLAQALVRQGDTVAASELLQSLLAGQITSAGVGLQVGASLKELGLLDDSVRAYRAAVAVDANCAAGHQSLGAVLQALSQPQAALSAFERAAQLEPQSPRAWCNLGTAYQNLERLPEAERSYRRALAQQPDWAPAHAHLAVLAVDRGDTVAALDFFEKSLQLDPDQTEVKSNQLFVLSYAGSAARYRTEAQHYGQLVTKQVQPFSDWLVERHHGTAAPDALRIGLVSGDLRAHPVGFFLEGVAQHLAQRGIALCAFATAAAEDATTARLKKSFATWTSLVGMSNAVAAERIRQQGIHLLVDLAGHTAHNRLPLFAWRAAPVQASWLGYFASTGVPAIDYLIADPLSVPDGLLNDFTETVWRLPLTRLCFTAPGLGSQHPIGTLPAARNGHLTLGCFQNFSKVNDRVLHTWLQVMNALPGSRLRLQNRQSGAGRPLLQARLLAAGIDLARVDFTPPAERASYLSTYNEVDMLLDTFPFPGGTTTCEALWMGVPTVTMAGSSMLGNQGQAMMGCAGLPDWIARDTTEYVQLALSHGRDLPRLAALRSGLREQVLASPLFDAPRFAEALAGAFIGMWEQRHAVREPGASQG